MPGVHRGPIAVPSAEVTELAPLQVPALGPHAGRLAIAQPSSMMTPGAALTMVVAAVMGGLLRGKRCMPSAKELGLGPTVTDD